MTFFFCAVPPPHRAIAAYCMAHFPPALPFPAIARCTTKCPSRVGSFPWDLARMEEGTTTTRIRCVPAFSCGRRSYVLQAAISVVRLYDQKRGGTVDVNGEVDGVHGRRFYCCCHPFAGCGYWCSVYISRRLTPFHGQQHAITQDGSRCMRVLVFCRRQMVSCAVMDFAYPAWNLW